MLSAGEGEGARREVLSLQAGFHHAAASFFLRGGRVEELLDMIRHAAAPVALQVI